MKRKARRDWKIQLAEPALHSIAQQVISNHFELLMLDYRLMASSSAWSTAPHEMSVRLVYRRKTVGGETVVTHLVHGVRME